MMVSKTERLCKLHAEGWVTDLYASLLLFALNSNASHYSLGHVITGFSSEIWQNEYASQFCIKLRHHMSSPDNLGRACGPSRKARLGNHLVSELIGRGTPEPELEA